jgi:nitrogen fixation/metabolism regulation signal transduction histidine kinase
VKLIRKIINKYQFADEQVYVLADKTQIQQVLLNLIFNASQSIEKVAREVMLLISIRILMVIM